MGGLYASYRLDVPTGAAIVCSLGVAMVLGAIASRLRSKDRGAVRSRTLKGQTL
jgi:ABC-type Mn2+/Zn2+ transport system permease subunit